MREQWAALIDRYLSGECSEVERRQFERLLRENAELRSHFESTRLWARSERAAGPKSPDVDRALANVRARLQSERAPVRRSSRRPVVALRWAAAMVAAAGLTWEGARLIRGMPGQAQRVAYTAAAGRREHITLPDGSQAELAPESSLQYEADRRGRRLTLTGRAFFRVVHDPNRPFSVRANLVRTDDIGTSFAVDAYPGAKENHVAVVEGRVAIRPMKETAAEATLLGPGEVARVDSSGHAFKSDDAVADYVSWTSGALRLHEASLPQIATEITRWYGVRVTADDPALADRRVTVTIGNMPLQTLLVTIARVTHTRVRQQGSAVDFVPNWGSPHAR